MITRLDTFGRPIYEPADILAVANYNFLGRASHLFFEPATFFYHYGLIGDYIESEDDYVIIESVNKGPTMGRLSWYKKKNYRILRVNQDHEVFRRIILNWQNVTLQSIGDAVVNKASKFGRHGYDFMLFVKLFAGVIRFEIDRLLHFKKPKRLSPTDVPYARDNALVCTELVFEAWRLVGILLRAKGHAPIPAEFCLSEWRKELIPIDSHSGRHGEPWRPKGPYNLKGSLVVDKEKGITISEALKSIERNQIRAGVEILEGQVQAVGITVDRPAPDSPGPDLIARQGGQKRNRVHVYRQPFGYAVRLCDWVAKGEIEIMFTCATWEEVEATMSTLVEAGEVTVCKHCLAVVQGKRRSIGAEYHGHGKGAPIP